MVIFFTTKKEQLPLTMKPKKKESEYFLGKKKIFSLTIWKNK